MIDYYDHHLDYNRLQKLRIREQTEWNHSYYPVIFETEELLTETNLNNNNIIPRRYFYPSLNHLPYVNHASMPVSKILQSTYYVCHYT